MFLQSLAKEERALHARGSDGWRHPTLFSHPA